MKIRISELRSIIQNILTESDDNFKAREGVPRHRSRYNVLVSGNPSSYNSWLSRIYHDEPRRTIVDILDKVGLEWESWRDYRGKDYGYIEFHYAYLEAIEDLVSPELAAVIQKKGQVREADWSSTGLYPWAVWIWGTEPGGDIFWSDEPPVKVVTSKSGKKKYDWRIFDPSMSKGSVFKPGGLQEYNEMVAEYKKRVEAGERPGADEAIGGMR